MHSAEQMFMKSRIHKYKGLSLNLNIIRIFIFFTFAFSFSAQGDWEFSSSGEMWGVSRVNSLSDSSLNIDNRILYSADQVYSFLFRPEVKLSSEESQIVIRPVWNREYSIIKLKNPSAEEYENFDRLNLDDFYWQKSWFENWQTTVGLFVDGWGPSEIANPTNPFFHAVSINKNSSFRDKGKSLAQALYSFDSYKSIIFTVEAIDNLESKFRADQEFYQAWLLRYDQQASQSSFSFGLVVGKDEFNQNILGGYQLWQQRDTGLSLTAEVRITEDASRFEVKDQIFGSEVILQSKSNQSIFSVMGIRYEGDVDLRAEWIHYDLGYNESEWDSLLQAVKNISIYSVKNIQRFSRPGLEFLSKNYLSLSFRKSNIGPWSDWQWIIRLLSAIEDNNHYSVKSNLFVSQLEAPFRDSWISVFEVQKSLGKKDSEFMLKNESSFLVAFRYSY